MDFTLVASNLLARSTRTHHRHKHTRARAQIHAHHPFLENAYHCSPWPSSRDPLHAPSQSIGRVRRRLWRNSVLRTSYLYGVLCAPYCGRSRLFQSAPFRQIRLASRRTPSSSTEILRTSRVLLLRTCTEYDDFRMPQSGSTTPRRCHGLGAREKREEGEVERKGSCLRRARAGHSTVRSPPSSGMSASAGESARFLRRICPANTEPGARRP